MGIISASVRCPTIRYAGCIGDDFKLIKCGFYLKKNKKKRLQNLHSVASNFALNEYRNIQI